MMCLKVKMNVKIINHRAAQANPHSANYHLWSTKLAMDFLSAVCVSGSSAFTIRRLNIHVYLR